MKKTLAKKIRQHFFFDILFKYTTILCASITLIIFISIIFYLIKGSLPALHAFGFAFLITSYWNPVTQEFGALVPIIGTLVTSFIALIIGIPISFGIAVFLTEISPLWLQNPLRIAIELLAGIPSIIYGMWGLFIFAPQFAEHVQPWLIQYLGNIPLIGVLFQGAPIGIGLLTAGIILGIMVIPFMASVMRDVFELVPDMVKESAYALGATKWEVIWRVILPYTRVGVIGGIMLGLGRALGETMAVAFLIGNAHVLTVSLMMPGNSITSVLANEFTEAVGTIYSSALITLGLILFVITFVVLICSKLLLRHLNNQTNSTAENI